jgi:hypothetical protein
MANVRRWIGDFLARHRAKFNPSDWPAEDAAEENREFLLGWITAFATREVTEAEADEASRLLVRTPPNWRREHVPAVLAKVDEIRRQKGGGESSSREAAREASRGCPHCGGEGLTGIWSESPDDARRIPRTASAYCVCPHGRWIKRRHAEQEPTLLKRIFDLGDVLDGSVAGWCSWPPDLERPPGDAKPAPAPGLVPSRASINAMFRVPDGV